MIPLHHISRFGLAGSAPEHLGTSVPGSDLRLLVTVVFSTTEGTLAALRTAATLAKDLAARVLLVVPHVVPLQFPVDRPPISVPFLEQRQLALVSASGIRAEEVNIQIYLCRNRKNCLREVLNSPSLVVVGGRNHSWFAKEQELERYLRSLGHHVVFAEMEAKTRVGSLLHSYLRPVFRRVLDLYQGM
jgi:hypothetical protein